MNNVLLSDELSIGVIYGGILNFSSFVSLSVRSFVRPSVTFFTTTSNVNNSVIFHRRTVPRVANERYCYIFFIFGEGWGKGVKGGPLGGTKKNKKRRKSPKNETPRRPIMQQKKKDNLFDDMSDEDMEV